METEPTDTRKMRDDQLNEALETDAAEELDGLSIRNQRLARIQEYEEAAVSRIDPFAALFGFGNADFQRIFDLLSAAIFDELDSRGHTIEVLRELAPEIRLLVKLRNSIALDLAVQPPDAGQQAAAFPRSMNGKGLDTKAATSKRDLLPKRWPGNA